MTHHMVVNYGLHDHMEVYVSALCNQHLRHQPLSSVPLQLAAATLDLKAAADSLQLRVMLPV